MWKVVPRDGNVSGLCLVELGRRTPQVVVRGWAL